MQELSAVTETSVLLFDLQHNVCVRSFDAASLSHHDDALHHLIWSDHPRMLFVAAESGVYRVRFCHMLIASVI